MQRRADYDKGVSLDVLLQHLGSVFGNPLPPGVTIVPGKSKTLLGTGSKGYIVLKAAANAAADGECADLRAGERIGQLRGKDSVLESRDPAVGAQVSEHFADRLVRACRAKGNALCVGLDPRWDLLPAEIRARTPVADAATVGGPRADAGSVGHEAMAAVADAASVGGPRADAGSVGHEAMADAYAEFCLRVLDVVAPLVPVVKPQSAFFEACGPAGLAALQAVLRRARERGLVTILDSKRNDIASTATAYADAVFGSSAVWPADAMTINPYLGRDAVEPFLARRGKLMPACWCWCGRATWGQAGSRTFDCAGKPLYRHVAEAVAAWAAEQVGECGYGDVGAVVGATHPAELAQIRQWTPNVVFLVPGYGAQGAARPTLLRHFGRTAPAPSSTARAASSPHSSRPSPRWEEAVKRATRAAIDDLARATPMAALAADAQVLHFFPFPRRRLAPLAEVGPACRAGPCIRSRPAGGTYRHCV